MSLPSHPDAQKDVVTTVTHVLSAFEDMVSEELTDCAPVYDEQLTFETGIKSYIAKNNVDQAARTDFPIFMYNRSQLRWPKAAPSRRLNTMNGLIKDGKEVAKYKATQSEFDIQFLYVCRSVEQQERFEVAYQNETGISANREITVSMGEPIGDFKSFLTYGELVSKTINYEDAAYTAIMGQITVRGFFFTFIGKASLIKKIRLQIFAKAGPPPDASVLVKSITLTST